MDVFLGGSRSAGPDTSGASPATLETVNYIDAQINGADYSLDVPGKLVVWGATDAGSLAFSLYEVNEDLSLGALLMTGAVPIASAVQTKVEITLPAFDGVKTVRLVAVLTGGVDAVAWYIAVIRSEAEIVEEFPAECTALQTALVNQALGMVGITKPLADVSTDVSVEAVMARLYLAPATKQCLRAFPWAFATKYADCTWVDGSADTPVNIDWTYSYRLPADALFVRRVIQRGAKRTYDPNPPAFRQGENDDSGRILFSDYYDPNSADIDAPTLPIEYTRRQNCTLAHADDLFTEALAALMAHKLAPAIAKNKVLASDWWAKHIGLIAQAKAQAANEQERQKPHDGDGDASWIAGRE